MHANQSLDLTNLEQTFEDDREGIIEILDMALADTLERVVGLEAALLASDATIAMQVAHAIKGAAANVGAFELSQAAGAIEHAARDNDLSAAVALLPAVTPAVARFELAVNAYRSSFS